MFGIEKDFRNLMEKVYGPLNKDKEPPDTIEIGGVKYKRIEEPQSFYDKLWGLLKTKLGDTVDCDETTDRVIDLIKSIIPKPFQGIGRPEYLAEYSVGYNEAIRKINEALKYD